MGREEREEREEEEKMLAGELYDASASELVAKRRRARDLTNRYNVDPRDELLRELLGGFGSGVEIVPPFRCDYGRNLFLGSRVFMNFDCVVLDCARVQLGDDVLLGPGVHIYAATHPVDAAVRHAGFEYAAPVIIGPDVWIGGRVIVGPGVTIGAGTTIGAGSVVVRDMPAGVVAAGNPCRVLRSLASSSSLQPGSVA